MAGRSVHVSAEAAEKWSAFSASHSGSVTNRFYNITLTPTATNEPIVVQCPRTDSARTTIQALEGRDGQQAVTDHRPPPQEAAARAATTPRAGELSAD